MKSRTLMIAALTVGLLPVDGRLLAEASQPISIAGIWTLNADKIDTAPAPPEGGDPEGGGQGGRGGPGNGGFGGGFGSGGRGGGGRANPEAMRRRRDALREIVEDPARMTITQSESMVIIITGDGRTTRLATDGSKVKDESTGIERKTRWEGSRLISEISGAVRAKMTETYSLDPETHQLVVLLQTGDGRSHQGDSSPGPRRRVYDPQRP